MWSNLSLTQHIYTARKWECVSWKYEGTVCFKNDWPTASINLSNSPVFSASISGDSHEKKIMRKEKYRAVLRSIEWHLLQIWTKPESGWGWGGGGFQLSDKYTQTGRSRKIDTPHKVSYIHSAGVWGLQLLSFCANSTVFKTALCLWFVGMLRGYWFHVDFASSVRVFGHQFITF